MSTVAIGQFGAVEDKTANLREIECLAQTAAENGVKMLFFAGIQHVLRKSERTVEKYRGCRAV